MKSTKEPKSLRKEKKSSAKPRKSSDKSKQMVAEPASQIAEASVAQPPAVAPAYVNESGNGNGAAASPAAPEALNGTGETSMWRNPRLRSIRHGS